MDWKRELVIAHLVKKKVAEVDHQGLWLDTLPEVAATEPQLRALETALGHGLDAQLRAFLLHANGWRAFMQYNDVFGSEDFLGGPRASRAAQLMASIEPTRPVCGFDPQDLLPVAVSSIDIDLFVMTRPHTVAPGQVLWFAGGLVDTFAGFDEFFLAMVDYNREEYQSLAEQSAPG